MNQFAAFTLNVMGCSSFMWHNKRNLVHHMARNVEVDDLDAQPTTRLN
jgi:linoleoyl-CoA desaturase